MQQCAQCGTPLAPGAGVCPNCGNFVIRTSSPLGGFNPQAETVAGGEDVAQLPFPSAPLPFGGPPVPGFDQHSPSSYGAPPSAFEQQSPSPYGMSPTFEQQSPSPYGAAPAPSFDQPSPSPYGASPSLPFDQQSLASYGAPPVPAFDQQSPSPYRTSSALPFEQFPTPSYGASPPAFEQQSPSPYGVSSSLPPTMGAPSSIDYAQQGLAQQQSFPYSMPQAPLPALAGSQPEPFPPSQRTRGLSKGALTGLGALTLLLIASGISLIFYTTVARPAQLRADATATVQTIMTRNAHAKATAYAEATATVQAYAQATAVAQAHAKATASALQSTFTQATNRTPALSSSMAFQDSANWDVYSAVGGGGCAFEGGALHSTISQKQFYVPCFAHATNFSNFIFDVQMTIVKGDEGGVVFRGNDAASKFYYFRVGRDGIYTLNVSKDDKTSTPILFDTSSAIKTGAGQTNQLRVVAQGRNIYLYINQQFVGGTSDSSYSAGEVGVFAGDNQHATDVAFNNARVWPL